MKKNLESPKKPAAKPERKEVLKADALQNIAGGIHHHTNGINFYL